jgi:DegV family protein with EDD domain
LGKDFIIVTDSCSDLPLTYVKEQEIEVVSLNLVIGDKTYKDDLGQSISHQEFFEAIDNGAVPMTSQPTPDAFYQAFKKGVAEGKSVLYLGVSSGLSGTFNSANIGKQMIEEEYPEANVVCFTTLIGSLGQALFVMKAIELKNEGKSLEEVVAYLSEKVKTQKNLILMSDLSHLKRGGRISGFESAIGSILKINPMIHIDKEGKAQPVDKIRGRNKGLKKLIEFVVENIENPETQTIAICHSNALDDAEKVKAEISKQIQAKDYLLSSIGPVIGSHSGTGAVVVFFLN